MQIGIDGFAAAISDPATGLTLSPVEHMLPPNARRISVSPAQSRFSAPPTPFYP